MNFIGWLIRNDRIRAPETWLYKTTSTAYQIGGLKIYASYVEWNNGPETAKEGSPDGDGTFLIKQPVVTLSWIIARRRKEDQINNLSGTHLLTKAIFRGSMI